MDLDTVLTTLYVLVDDWYKAEGAGLVTRHKGGKQLMSDSEVLTLAIIGQWEVGVPWRSERGLVRFLHAHGRAWFPHLLQVSAFNRRVRHLCTALAALQRWVARLLEQGSAIYEVMDGLPLPVCSLGQMLREEQHWLGQVSAKGHGGTHGGWFYGQRWWVCVTAQGAIRDWLLAAANINERWVLDRFLAARAGVAPVDPPEDRHKSRADRPKRPDGFIGGYFAVGKANDEPGVLDRGLNGETWRLHWEAHYRARMVSVPPDNAPERVLWTRQDCKSHASRRQVIETVFARLTTVFGVKHIGAHSLWGQYTRLAAKAAAFNCGLWLNRQLGRPSFALAALII
jgi:hypothetical protein